MQSYPLIFKFKDLIAGPGFLAGVQIEGHVLMNFEEDENEWWLYGVHPGGISEGGATPEEAHLKFRAFFRGVLADLAEEAGNYEAFCSQLHDFVKQENKAKSKIWIEKRAAIRFKQLTPSDIVSNYERITADCPARVVNCVRLDQQENRLPKSSDNSEYEVGIATAA